MKKWMMGCLLSTIWIWPMMASANQSVQLCGTVSYFGGEVFEARRAGYSRLQSLAMVNSAVANLHGNERAVFTNLFQGMVAGVYDLPEQATMTSDAEAALAFKYTFMQDFYGSCLRYLN
ncbi:MULTISPECIES: hypothetical protein [Vitreoscilla]|uniref:Uncharacterized protein n=1 Tax=Vitreoscilla stercoraria TaxID=61 RepID=A0ABY4EB24_VITST|nr:MULTISPECIES: hypothetical protein [Vitreoscilla]AUZ05642.1 hypothetical protein ADP71_22540 [Vitreoscilla sp. C1]UOO92947.1 hypothetical protein LVJ81_02590 [Vitreoscilla stercoraria]